MTAAFALLSLASPGQQAEKVKLPDTPQAKHVRAYIEAFNTGDVKKYLAMQEEHLAPDALQKRSAGERTKMFERLRADFGTLAVKEVLSASAERIDLAVPDRKGTTATFSFRFEAPAPFRIAGIAVEIDGGGQP